MKIGHLLFFGIALFLSSFVAKASSGAGLTYHGRLVAPDGTPVSASNVQFRLQIKTPGNENCLMYEELQSKDMSSSNGIFSVTMNDGSGSRMDSSGYGIDQIFANRGTFTFASGQCAAGTTYNTNATDGRKLQVYFNDGSFSGWEPVPSQDVNFVPLAIEALQVGGYKKEQLLKIADGVPTGATELSSASWTELLALIGGTTTQYLKPGSAVFSAAPQWSGTPTGANDLANKSYVDAQVAAGLPNFGTAGTYTKVTTDAKGRVSSGTTLAAADIPALDASKITSGVLPIANGGTNSNTALTGNKVMISSATSIVEGLSSNTTKASNTFVLRDGSGNLAAALGTFDALSLTAGGGLTLNGATSGNVSLTAPSAVTSYSITLPTSAGATGQVLTTNGTGILSWTSPAGGLPAAAGTAAAPAYAFSGNTNTGMFGAATNQIGLSTNGSERVRIDASGNVGIGTTAPDTLLTIKTTNTTADVFMKAKNSSGVTIGALNSSYDNGELKLFNSSGLETTSMYTMAAAGPNLYANASTYSKIDGTTSAYGTGLFITVPNSVGSENGIQFSDGGVSSAQGAAINFYVTDNTGYGRGGLKFKTSNSGSPTTRMVISEVGNVGVGTSAPNATLQVNGTITGKPAVVNATGTVDFGTGNLQYTASSCGAFQFNNLKDGGSYTFIVQGTTSATCSFTAFSDAGVTSLTVHMPPDIAATIAGKHTVFNLMVGGTHLYVAWTPGY